MGTMSEQRVVNAATTFMQELDTGAPLDDALCSIYSPGHPEIVAIATEMLATDGAIDMKRLAQRVGLSRASLYRYYPDRCQLESEIAARGAQGLATEAAAQPTRAGKLRAAAEYLVSHPGEAAAMIPLAATVSVDVLRTTTEAITGNPADTAWIVGFAVIAATPGRDEADVAAMKASIDEAVAEFV